MPPGVPHILPITGPSRQQAAWRQLLPNAPRLRMPCASTRLQPPSRHVTAGGRLAGVVDPLTYPLPAAPSMRLYCFYGVGIPTERAYHYLNATAAASTKSTAPEAEAADAQPVGCALLPAPPGGAAPPCCGQGQDSGPPHEAGGDPGRQPHASCANPARALWVPQAFASPRCSHAGPSHTAASEVAAAMVGGLPCPSSVAPCS
jgi:hypothetical protein